MQINLKASLALALLLQATSMVEARGINLHWLWHNHCTECHGHAGDFARKFLNVSNGELQGVHHVHDLREFMRNHYLSDNDVDAIYNMLLAQASIPPRFKEECSSCHNTAADFVSNSLELRDGVLYGRKTGAPIRQFLSHHRKLNSEDIEFFMVQLSRVANEVFRP